MKTFFFKFFFLIQITGLIDCTNDIQNRLSCPKGKWGANCTEDCDSNCNITTTNCDEESGICFECNSGYYPNKKECIQCPIECKFSLCSSEGCHECSEEKGYGNWCNFTCSNCLDSTQEGKYCSREDGKCYGQCVEGFFGDKCNDKCIEKCDTTIENCDKDTGNCKYCYSGYYPPLCESCREDCKECSSFDICTVCTDKHYFGIICDKPCSKNCKETEDDSPICDIENGICYSCKDTFYGEQCTDECKPNCKQCNQTTGICLECFSDYYLSENNECMKCRDTCDQCDKDKCIECKSLEVFGDNCTDKCPEHCYFEEGTRKCDRDTGFCKSCDEFFEGNKCDHCIMGKWGSSCEVNCSEGCDISIKNCEMTTGSCESCIKGYYGTRCEYICPDFCIDCNQKGECLECEIGYYLDETKCKKCESDYCEGGCTKEGCIKCINDTFWDKWCEQECPLHCKEQKCKKDTGYCECEDYFRGEQCDKCIFNHTGTNCNLFCNRGCNISEELDINCDIDGKCSCQLGFYKEDCSKECPNNCNFTEGNCDKEEGYCLSCINGFFSKNCDIQCLDQNCLSCNFETGECLICKEDYYLNGTDCMKCPSTCKGGCTIDGCLDCKSNIQFGQYCNETCPLHCLYTDETKRKCNQIDGKCIFGCEELFEGDQCEKCTTRHYGINCTEICNKGCKTECDRDTGSCKLCEMGYWGDNCNDTCPVYCDTQVKNCGKENGYCRNCYSGYYLNNCTKCPLQCDFACDEESGCERCISKKYGDWCDKDCNSTCEDNCDKNTGVCDSCKQGYYSDYCEQECSGCLEGCSQNGGKCLNQKCKDSFFNPELCNKKCGSNCENNLCDIYSGDCLSCRDKRYGPNCEFTCSKECQDDPRIDCCFAKSNHITYPNFSLSIDEYGNDMNSEYFMLTFYIGEGLKTKIEALIDFDSNYPLIVFDKSVHYVIKQGNLSIVEAYDSSLSYSFNKTEKEENIECFFFNSKFIGDLVKEKIYFFTNVNEEKEIIAHFLQPKSIEVNQKFNINKPINAIVGLGFLNTFCDDLYQSGLITKNIMSKIKEGNKINLLFGDYPKEIKKEFIQLTTMIPLQKFSIRNQYEIQAKLSGFTYLYNKAYKFEQNITLSNSVSNVLHFTQSYQPFFDKIYFKDYLDSICTLKVINKETKQYICEEDPSQLKLPLFGLIIDGYIYYLSKDILFKKIKDNTYEFQIVIKTTPKIILGKEFLSSYKAIYNNGNHTFNFFGETKRLTINITDPTGWSDSSNNEWLTPGAITVLSIFGIVLFVLAIYIIYYCSREPKLPEEEDSLLGSNFIHN